MNIRCGILLLITVFMYGCNIVQEVSAVSPLNHVITYDEDLRQHCSYTDRLMKTIYLLQNETCLHFVEGTTGNRLEIRETGCEPPTTITKGNDKVIKFKFHCNCNEGIERKMMALALGLQTEELRSDRDNYVTIMTTNIPVAKRAQFAKSSSSNVGSYDYMSILHSSGYFLIPNHIYANSIVTRDIRYQYLIGERTVFSFNDIKKLNKLYGCNGKCFNKAADCGQNGGYIGPKCKCVCPKGTSGQRCEIGRVEHPYVESCSLKVKLTRGVSQIIRSGSPRTMKEFCSWEIEAPTNMRVRLSIIIFSFVGRRKGYCTTEYVEIRKKLNQNTGEFYCGTELNVRGKDIIFSEGNKMKILIKPYPQDSHLQYARDSAKTKTRGMEASVIAV